jgi:hypothetical protein
MKVVSMTIPDWFDLKKYSVCETWGRADWDQHLDTVRDIYKACENSFNGTSSCEWYQRHLARFPDNIGFIQKYRFPVTHFSLDDALRIASFAGRITNGDKDILTSGEKDHLERVKSAEERTFVVPPQEINESLSESFFSRININDTASFNVNLNYSDKEIIDSFTRLLETTRQKNANKRTYTGVDYEKWHERKILPFLHLKAWCRLTSEKIPHSQISKALFQEDYAIDHVGKIRDAEFVRGTLTKNAISLLGDVESL